MNTRYGHQEEVDAYVTSLPAETASPGQVVMHYHKRADAENVFDELKTSGASLAFSATKQW